MELQQLESLFEDLKTKRMICWGKGKHYRNITEPFLKESGLISNLEGLVEGKEELDSFSSGKDVVILVAVKGYKEICTQIQRNPKWKDMKAIPALYLEALYEDRLMLAAKKPPIHFRKNERPVIPKVIHTFWFSGEGLPPKYELCLNTWKKYAPDFEIKIWNLESYHPGECLFFQQAVSEKNWAFASDYARADVLRRFGGVYMDLDVEMLRPIDELLYNDAYMGFESMERIECGSGMGAKKGNKILDEICKSYETRPYFKEDGSWDNSTCPVRYTQVIEKHGLVKNGGFQMVEDITVYPFEVLTGKSFDTGIIYKTKDSFTTHHHKGNWVPHSAHHAMEKRYEEIEAFLREQTCKNQGKRR